MKLQVDKSQRYAKMRAHTATHLLHAEIAKFFPNTKQAGSMVDDDLLRFDFVADRLLSPQEISDIEKKVNQIIYATVDVVVNEMSIDEASKLGAKMFFEDKYGDTVRVVKVGDEDETISMEFCGGTHVTNTKDIGAFTILSQEAVASGVKRISAITGPKVIEKLQEKQLIVDGVMEKLGVKGENQIADRLDKILKEYEKTLIVIQNFEEKETREEIQNDRVKMSGWFNKIIQVSTERDFKKAVSLSKLMFKGKNILICNQNGSFAIISDGKTSAQEMKDSVGLKGGGNFDIVQGRDMNAVKIYLNAPYYQDANLEVVKLSDEAFLSYVKFGKGSSFVSLSIDKK